MSPLHSTPLRNHGQRFDKRRMDKVRVRVIVIVTSVTTPPGLTESRPPLGLTWLF